MPRLSAARTALHAAVGAALRSHPAIACALNRHGYYQAGLRTGYLSLEQAESLARKASQPLREYMTNHVYGAPGQDGTEVVQGTLDRIERAGCFRYCEQACEIGSGVGIFTEPVMARLECERYVVYEIDQTLAEYTRKRYGVVPMAADGRSLRPTPDRSCGLVQAYGLFENLNFLISVGYFEEMMRVCAPEGYVIFDYFSIDAFDDATIKRWLATTAPYPVVYPREWVHSFFTNHGFRVLDEIDQPCAGALARCIVLQRQA